MEVNDPVLYTDPAWSIFYGKSSKLLETGTTTTLSCRVANVTAVPFCNDWSRARDKRPRGSSYIVLNLMRRRFFYVNIT